MTHTPVISRLRWRSVQGSDSTSILRKGEHTHMNAGTSELGSHNVLFHAKLIQHLGARWGLLN